MIRSALLFSILFLFCSLAGYTQNVEELIKQGDQKFLIENYRGAIEDFTNSIKIDPNCSKAYAKRGLVKLALKEYKGAIIDYDQAIKLGREDGNIYACRGFCRYKLDDYYGAISDFTKALEFDPTDQYSSKRRESARLKLNEKLSKDSKSEETVQPNTRNQKDEAKNNSKTSTLIYKEPEIYSLQNGGAAIRELPDTESKALLMLSQGTEVMVSSITNNFCKVNSNGTVGYINKFLLTKGSYTGKILPTSSLINIESNINKVYSYTAKLERACTVIDQPEITGNTIGRMTEGSEVVVLGKIDNFYKVNYEGKIGYIDKIFFDQPNYSNGQGNYASQTNKSSDVKFPSQNPKNEEEKILDSWLNSKKEALIKANGPPDAVSSDGKGGEIYSYGITQRTVLSPGISTSYHSDNPYVFEKDVTFYDPAITQVNSRSRMFFINEEGIIYYWLIKSK